MEPHGPTSGRWREQHLVALDAAEELEIASPRTDGAPARWTPVWVVRVDDEVFVRTWQRRTTGWYGRALASGSARIRAVDLEADAVVEDAGVEDAALRGDVDDAYRRKYRRYGSATVDRMVSDEAAATTLRLRPAG